MTGRWLLLGVGLLVACGGGGGTDPVDAGDTPDGAAAPPADATGPEPDGPDVAEALDVPDTSEPEPDTPDPEPDLPDTPEPEPHPTADLVLRDARVYTLDPEQPWAEAVAITGGAIVWVGAEAEVDLWIGADTVVEDLDQRMVMPGVHDIHAHPLEAGSPAFGDCWLESDASPEDNAEIVADCAVAQADQTWVLGFGQSLWTLMESWTSPCAILDGVVPDRPAAMMDETSHSVWVNSRALQVLGIDATTPDPVGGVIVPDYDGTPWCVLMDEAGDLAMEVALAPNAVLDELGYEGLLWSLDQLARNGITSVADARTYRTRNHVEIWQRAADEETLTARATLGLWAYPGHDDATQLEELMGLYDPDGDDWLRVSQVKLYSDGIVVNTTAAMLEPYVETWGVSGPLGLNYFDAERLAAYLVELEAVGFDLHVHAIGDRGVREGLDAVEAGIEANGLLLDRRHHLTHLEYVHPDDVGRFQELGVVADFQVSGEFVEPEHRYLEAWSVGEERIDEEFLPLRAVWETGAPVALSSDWDVGALSPFVGMERALSIGPERSLPDVAAAIEAYTLTPAWALRQQELTGSVEVGKQADLIVLDRDLFEIPTEEISETQVLLTLVEGYEVFRSEALPR